MELLTAAQMRAIEQAAIDSGEVTGLELMERAGQGVVEAIFEEWPELAASARVEGAGREYLDQEEERKAVVLCGPGNNGGDGFVVARLLHERGWGVEVFLYGDPDKLPPDAKVNYERWEELGDVTPLETSSLQASEQAQLYIDALFGTGLTKPLQGAPARAAEFLRILPRGEGDRVVSVDAPSGLCLDSGSPLHRSATEVDWVAADLTVTFHTQKLGHFLNVGPAFCRKVVVKSIGLEGTRSNRLRAEAKRQPGRAVRRFPAVSPDARVRLTEPNLTALEKSYSQHKYSHGHALILSGGAGRTGAARLAARGALRIGAGLVTLGVPGAAQMVVASQITAIMLRRVDDAMAFAEVLEDERFKALCLGPGMGLGEASRGLVEAGLTSGRACVLDADALTAFSESPGDLLAMVHKGCVLTPHGGEFARLFPDIAARLNETPTRGPAYSKVDATREAARRAGCVVLFKGPDAVIAAPDGRCSINAAVYDRAAPWLATAGSGDVLAGFITGLLARGFAPMQAAETAAWLHVECARAFGPGLIAEDLPEALPGVFRDLGL